MSARPDSQYDVVIVGAGPAGLCFARSLASTPLRIALVEKLSEAELADPPFDGREIALTHASRRLLKRLDVWAQIPPEEISPLRDAQVRDGRSPGVLRFDHRDSGTAELGYLVPNHLIRRAAYAAVQGQPQLTLITGAAVADIRTHEHAAVLTLADGRRLQARLVVAADSRFSETRRAMGIPAAMHDFGKTMLVCRMRHAQPHGHVADEWFDYGATLALLPLNGDCSSVVITQTAREIELLRQMPEDAFAREIERRLQHRLGAMQLASGRHVYPLVGVYPRRFVATRYALIGDAAVGMHPVTAHGFNFGLSGQHLLAAGIRSAAAAGLDIAAPALLARYDAEHRRATRPLYLATQAIVKLYTDDRAPARLARSAALRIGSRLRPFRKAVAALLAARG